METRVIRSWLLGVALAAPLLVITAWLVRGALDPRPVHEHAPATPPARPSAAVQTAAAVHPAMATQAQGADPSAPADPGTPEDRAQADQPAQAVAPSAAAGSTAADPAAGSAWPPSADLPADRLEERVDGAADALRAAGCRRLVYWRSEAPAADAEALLFDTVEHARASLSREAGEGRTPGPGEEAQVSEQAVYFRRGKAFVRVFADPGATDGAALLRLAKGLERAVAGLHD